MVFIFLDGGNFSDIGFDQAGNKCESDLVPDPETERLLQYFPWEHNRKVYKWRKDLKMSKLS